MRRWVIGLVGLGLAGLDASAPAAELVRLSAENYERTAPVGKEVDAIYGDYCLRSDKLIAVVAGPAADRRANMTTPRVAGCVIDLTRRDRPNDQLTCFYPGGMQYLYTAAKVVEERGEAVQLVCTTGDDPTGLQVIVTYTLRDGDDYLSIARQFVNNARRTKTIALMDGMRADTSFTKVSNGATNLFWVHDDWFKQAYGLTAKNLEMTTQSDNRRSQLTYASNGRRSIDLLYRDTFDIQTRLFVADNLLALKGNVAAADGKLGQATTVVVKGSSGRGIGHVLLTVSQDAAEIGQARTDEDGSVMFRIPRGKYHFVVTAPANGAAERDVEIRSDQTIVFALPAAPEVAVQISDEAGGRIPCKLQFQGIDGTKDPYFGPNTQAPGVNNLYYSRNGRFELAVPAGTYKILISRGPEYDLETKTVTLRSGGTTPLNATLRRVVKTDGWVSSDIHGHSTPSGDNTTTMEGRVLNLLCEHVEFAPCTEHNRLDTYEPILKRLGCEKLMATCTGIEVTGQPLPINHQNAFPLKLRFGLQDNGGPREDVDPELQIRRLAEWDNRSNKLVQQNHPDMGWLYFDRNGDGNPDGGFSGMFEFQNVVEVWGNGQSSLIDESILSKSALTPAGYNNRLFNWLQILNLGRRMVGVANTDAHYTDHGSGWVRNYVRAATDDPAQLHTADMVRNYSQGRVIMTNGPFLEVQASSVGRKAGPGGNLVASESVVSLDIGVQCANWYDINRVQVLVNGRQPPEYNFTRKTHASLFGSGVMRFKHTVDVKVDNDAHLIVVATGEGLGFGDVMGPALKAAPPTAISNPIYVTKTDGPFTANRDTLEQPLPVKAEARKAREQKSKEQKTKTKSKK